MKYGLKQYMVDAILRCMASNPNIEEAILYGSRAMGNYRPGSDVDLTLKGKTLSVNDLYKLDKDIDDLLLPYKFDISIYKDIDNEDLKDHIRRVGIIFYKK